MKRILMIAILLLGIALVAVACGDDDDDGADGTTTTEEAAATGTIVEVATENGFSTLVTAVEAAGLTETLSGEGPFTVFAPTDEAFAALPEGTLDALLADTDALSDVLTYHVVSGDLKAADVVELDSVDTLQGEAIAITVEDDVVTLNGTAKIVTADVAASNGTIHVIDAVLTPPAG
jgi:uncharacterized surface protein with fasciclin (FAS1) repeats